MKKNIKSESLEMSDIKKQLVLAFSTGSRNNQGTSQAAEKDITDSGIRETHYQTVYTALRRITGATTLELAAKIGSLEEKQVRKRLCDLIESDLIRRGDESEKRICEVSARKVLTFWII